MFSKNRTLAPFIINCQGSHKYSHSNVNPLSPNDPKKWSNTFKQFVGSYHCLSVFDHFVGFAPKGLNL